MDIRVQTSRAVSSALSATVLTLLASTSAFAATNAVTPCEQVKRDMKSLDVPVGTLAVDAVDHVPIEPDLALAMPDDESAPAEAFDAPILRLTPRVTNILRDVFGESAAAVEPATPAEASSPLADRDLDIETPPVPVSPASEDQVIPPYQRRMYRTDI